MQFAFGWRRIKMLLKIKEPLNPRGFFFLKSFVLQAQSEVHNVLLHVVHLMIFSPFLTNRIIVKIQWYKEKFQVQFALGRRKKKMEEFNNIIRGSPVNDSILFLGFARNTFTNNSNVVASLWQLSIDAGTQHNQWL